MAGKGREGKGREGMGRERKDMIGLRLSFVCSFVRF
jgi:hypothetical protein